MRYLLMRALGLLVADMRADGIDRLFRIPPCNMTMLQGAIRFIGQLSRYLACIPESLLGAESLPE